MSRDWNILSGKYCLPITVNCQHFRLACLLPIPICLGPSVIVTAYSSGTLCVVFFLCAFTLCVGELYFQVRSLEVKLVTVNTAGEWSLVQKNEHTIEGELARHARFGGMVMLILTEGGHHYQAVVIESHCDSEQFHRLKLYLDVC